MRATIVPRVTIEFIRDTVIRGPEGIVDEHRRGARIEAYVDSKSWRVPQDAGREDYYVYPGDARQVAVESQNSDAVESANRERMRS